MKERRFLRRILAVSAAAALLCTPAYAFRERIDTRGVSKTDRGLATKNDVFLDDFAAMNTLDDYVTTLSSPSYVQIEKIDNGQGGTQNVMGFYDGQPGTDYAGPIVTRAFPRVSGDGTAVLKFRFKVNFNGDVDHASGLRFYLTGNGRNIIELRVSGDSGNNSGSLQFYDGTNTSNLGGVLKGDMWYTISVGVDMEYRTADVLVECDAFPSGYYLFENLPIYSTAPTPVEINGLLISGMQRSSTYYFDYIKVERGGEVTKPPRKIPTKPEPLPVPTSEAPVMRPVPGQINVSLNGQYLYFDTAPVYQDGNLMVTARSAFRVLGMSMTFREDGGYHAVKGGAVAEVAPDGGSITLGGVPADPAILGRSGDGKITVALNKLAEYLGLQAQWNQEEQTLYLNGQEAE